MNLVKLDGNYTYQTRKAGLARLIANENVSVLFKYGIKTAAFDVAKRVVYLPIFAEGISNELMDLFVIHEMGHGLYTPPTKWEKSIKKLVAKYGISPLTAKDVLNVLEDVRINELLKTRFPGSVRDFSIGYRHRWERGDYGIKENQIPTLPLLDRVNLRAKIGHVVNVLMNTDESNLFDQFMAAKTWEDVERNAHDLIKHVQKNSQDMGGAGGDGDVDAEKMEVDLGELDAELLKKLLKNLGKESGEGSGGIKMKISGADLEKLLGGQTEKNEENAQAKSVDKGNGGDLVYHSATDLRRESIVTYKDILTNRALRALETNNKFAEWFQDVNKSVTKMISLFEMKKAARAYRKTQINKTGMLNMNRIHHYRISDDVFRKNQVQNDGKNHGFIFMLDTSGSMMDNMIDTRRQAAMMALFAKRLGVPFEFYTFSSELDNRGVSFKPVKTGEFPALVADERVQLTRIFDNRMSPREFNAMLRRVIPGGGHQRRRGWIDAGGGTPLNSSLLAMYDLGLEFVKTNKVDILNFVFITDGGATDNFRVSRAGSSYSSIHGRDEIAIYDPETAKTYALGTTGDSNKDTKAVINYLRDRYADHGIERTTFVNFYIEHTRGEKLISVNKRGKNGVGYDVEWTIDPRALRRASISKTTEAEKFLEVAAAGAKDFNIFLQHFTETVAEGT